MKIAGNIELINGAILNLKVEEVESIDFETIDSNRLVVYDGALYFNNGVGYYPIMFDNAFSENTLLTSLGTNWLNPNQSFNPTPFNALSNVSGLTSSSSLFNVIEQIDAAIQSISIDSIFDMSNVNQSGSLAAGQVLIYGVSSFFNLSLQSAFDSYVSFRIQDAADFATTAALTNLNTITWDSETSKFVNNRSYYTHSSETSSASYVLAHNLGKRYCLVEVIDKSTNLKIPSSEYTVEYFTTNLLGVTLNTSAVAHIIVFSLS